MSPYHFHRVFKATTGESVRRYVERRRLGHAFVQRRNGALWKLASSVSGFKSQTSFARAFKRVYGLSPSQWEARNPALGEGTAADPLQVAIVDRPAARLAVSRVWGGESNPARLHQGFRQLVDWANASGLDTGEGKLFGMSMDDPAYAPLERCRHDFALVVPDGLAIPNYLIAGHRSAGRWAVIRIVGDADTIHQRWHDFYIGWLARSEWKLRAEPVEEHYLQWPDTDWNRTFEVECCAPVCTLEKD